MLIAHTHCSYFPGGQTWTTIKLQLLPNDWRTEPKLKEEKQNNSLGSSSHRCLGLVYLFSCIFKLLLSFSENQSTVSWGLLFICLFVFGSGGVKTVVPLSYAPSTAVVSQRCLTGVLVLFSVAGIKYSDERNLRERVSSTPHSLMVQSISGRNSRLQFITAANWGDSGWKQMLAFGSLSPSAV